MTSRVLILTLLIAVFAGETHAQQRGTTRQRPATPAQPVTPPVPVEPPPAVYEPQLLRLAEITGALAFMSDLCAAKAATPNDGNAWHAKMKDLIDAEAGNNAMRDRIAGAFNRGLTGYRTTYRTCTPSGELALQRLLKEGARLTQDLTSRYGS